MRFLYAVPWFKSSEWTLLGSFRELQASWNSKEAWNFRYILFGLRLYFIPTPIRNLLIPVLKRILNSIRIHISICFSTIPLLLQIIIAVSQTFTHALIRFYSNSLQNYTTELFLQRNSFLQKKHPSKKNSFLDPSMTVIWNIKPSNGKVIFSVIKYAKIPKLCIYIVKGTRLIRNDTRRGLIS